MNHQQNNPQKQTNQPALRNNPTQNVNRTQNMDNMQNAYCKNCGSQIFKHAEICPSCGVRQHSPSKRSRNVSLVFAFFLGSFGVHKFYLGRTTAGVLYLIFFWTFIPALLSFIDLLILIFMSEEEFRKKYGE